MVDALVLRLFKTRVLRFKVKNTPLNDKEWKEKVQKNSQFSFRGGREASHLYPSRNSTLFSSQRSTWSEKFC